MPLLTVYINYKNRLLKTFSAVFDHLCVKIYLGVLIAVNSAIWMVVYYITTKVTQDLVVLHYNVDFGVDLVGDVGNMYMIPATGLVILVINLLLVFLFSKQKDLRVISHFLLGAATAANFFLLISLIPIYFINFS
jgi:hypothetical protein